MAATNELQFVVVAALTLTDARVLFDLLQRRDACPFRDAPTRKALSLITHSLLLKPYRSLILNPTIGGHSRREPRNLINPIVRPNCEHTPTPIDFQRMSLEDWLTQGTINSFLRHG